MISIPNIKISVKGYSFLIINPAAAIEIPLKSIDAVHK